MEKRINGIQWHEINGKGYLRALDVLEIVSDEIRRNDEEMNCEKVYQVLSRIKAMIIIGGGTKGE